MPGLRKAASALGLARLRWRCSVLPRLTLRPQLALLYAGFFLAAGRAVLAIPILHDPDAAPQGARVRHRTGRNARRPRRRSSARSPLSRSLVAVVTRGRLADRRPVPAAAARDYRDRPGHLRQQPEPAAGHGRPRATSSPNSGKRSTACSGGWRHRSSRSGNSSPTPPTSCAPRSPPGGPCSRSRSPIRTPTVETLRATCEELLALGDQQERLIDALLTLASSERGIEQLGSLRSRRHRREGDPGPPARSPAPRHPHRAALAAAPATGDPSLAESLVANLVDNAIRHNLAGGQVEISTAQ